MSRMGGTVSMGIRAPIIRSGDDLVEIVTNSVLETVKDGALTIRDRDVIAMTEAIVARAQGNYASVDDIAADVRAKLGGETVGVLFPILSRNRFAICLRGIANVRVVAGAYIFCALMSAVAGLILTGYHNIASLTLAGDYSMNSLAAALIGGNAIEGGRGGVWGVVLGSFFMMLLMAILTMLGISQVGKLIIQGCIILAVVAAQQLWKKD